MPQGRSNTAFLPGIFNFKREVMTGMASVRISVNRLRPGMFVVDPGVSWLEEPHLYTREGMIADQDEIDRIITQGFAEVCYDPIRSLRAEVLGRKTDIQTSLAEEIHMARGAYTAAYDHVKGFMQNAASGRVDVASIEPCLASLVQSIIRNSGALLSLANLKGLGDYTYRHSVNVAVFSVAFARYLGVQGDDLRMVGIAGLFHDYGKALLPAHILNAPRRLNAKELEITRSHVLLGYEKLKDSLAFSPEILGGILQHHERHDGSGYPYGLSGDEIGLYGRIISICDVYDALASKRVYKDAVHPKHALGTLFKMGDSAWAPGYAEHFIKMIGIFPIGTCVLLSNGQKGVVCHSDPVFPSLPCVLLIKDRNSCITPYKILDLSRQKRITVNRSLSKTETASWDVPQLLDFAEEIQMH